MSSQYKYCAQHNMRYGIRCDKCVEDALRKLKADQLRVVSYEEWLEKYGPAQRL